MSNFNNSLYLQDMQEVEEKERIATQQMEALEKENARLKTKLGDISQKLDYASQEQQVSNLKKFS